MEPTGKAMLAPIVKQNQFLLNYVNGLVADIPNERFTEQPFPAVNHPAWIIGHLILSGDNSVGMLGGDKTISDEWAALFKGGQPINDDRSAFPSKEELMATLHERYATLQHLAVTASPEILSTPTVNRRLMGLMPLQSDLVTFALTGHFAIHLGQLSMWRRLIGMPPLF